MVYTITAGQPITLGEKNPENRILQSILLLMQTRQGTVPFDRGFGIPMNFIGKPSSIAAAGLAAELQEAISTYAPQARIKSVRIGYDENGRIIPTVEVQINA